MINRFTKKTRPRLKKCLHALRISDREILLKDFRHTLALRGESVERILSGLMPKLNGKNTVEDLTRRLGIERSILMGILRELNGRHLLEDDSPGDKLRLDPISSRQLDDQLTYFSQFQGNKFDFQRRLRDSKVAILGLKGTGYHIALSFANAGVGKILAVDPASEEADTLESPFLGRDDLGKPLIETLEGRLDSQFPLLEFTGCAKRIASVRQLRRLIEDCHLIVVCLLNPYSPLLEVVNKCCLELLKPWLSAYSFGDRAFVGPTVIPGETPCYECFQLRAFSTEQHLDEQMLWVEHFRRNPDSEIDLGGLACFRDILSGFITMECLRVLTSYAPPLTYGRLLTIDFLDYGLESHEILRVPRCPSCAPPSLRTRSKRSYILKKPESLNMTMGESKPAGLEEVLSKGQRMVSEEVGIIKDIRRVRTSPLDPQSIHIYRARMSNNSVFSCVRSGEYYAGTGFSEDEALAAAFGEAVERYCASTYHPGSMTKASHDQVRHLSLNPAELLSFKDEQYPVKDSRLKALDSSDPIHWDWGYSLTRRKQVLVPALYVYCPYELESFDFPSSTGLAAGTSREQAIQNAIFEIIERDAFVVTWVNKLLTPVLDLETTGDETIREFLKECSFLDIRVLIRRIDTDIAVPTFAAILLDESGKGPPLSLGCACHLDPLIGIKRALKEAVGTRYTQRLINQQKRLPRSRAKLPVRTIEDHALFYSGRESLKHVDFLTLPSPMMRFTDIPCFDLGGYRKNVGRCLEILRGKGMDTIAVDLTQEDVGSLGFSVVRVIVPGMVPMYFGEDHIPMSKERLYRVPKLSGFRRLLPQGELNRVPHPFL